MGNLIADALASIFGSKSIQGSAVNYPWYDQLNGKYRLHGTDGSVTEVSQVPPNAIYYPDTSTPVPPTPTNTPQPTPAQIIAGFTTWNPPAQYSDLVNQASQTYGVPAPILAALIQTESGFNPKTPDNVNYDKKTGKETSRDRGYVQINSHFFPNITESQYKDPVFATDFAAQQLAHNHNVTGDWSKATAAYNVGLGGLSNTDSVNNYLNKITKNLDSGTRQKYGLKDSY